MTPHSASFDDVGVLSFDIYGTLIDWETGIYTNLCQSPLGPHLGSRSRSQILQDYERLEGQIQNASPHLRQSQIMEELFRRYAAELSVTDAHLDEAAQEFGGSIGSWPAFPDTVEAMSRLGKTRRLVALSNIDAASYAQSKAGALRGVHFDAVYMAEDIGSYKPNPANFEYLIGHVENEFNTPKERMLHVACALFHDVAPATKMGLRSVWVDRKGAIGSKLGPIDLAVADEADVQRAYGYLAKVNTLAELADLLPDTS